MATGRSWDDTYKHLSNTARLKGKMMDDKNFIRDYLDERYERIENIPITVGEVAGEHSDNVLLITMPNHIVCSVYGTVYDSFDCRNKIAEYCWLVR